MLELQPIEPLARISNALDSSVTGAVKLKAIWTAVFFWGGIFDRVTLFCTVWRDAFRNQFKKITLKEAVSKLKEAKINHIPIGETQHAEDFSQIRHLGLKQPGYIKSPLILHSRNLLTGGNKSAPKLGEHNQEYLCIKSI